MDESIPDEPGAPASPDVASVPAAIEDIEIALAPAVTPAVPGAIGTSERAGSILADARTSHLRDDDDALEKRRRYEAFIASHHMRPWDGIPHVGTIVLAEAGAAILHVGRDLYMAIEAGPAALAELVVGERFTVHGDGHFERDTSGQSRGEASERAHSR